MAYGQTFVTNNRAEYLGLIAGLREACRHRWSVEVVGDSALVIRQLSRFLSPKHPLLRPLYSEARRLADVAGVPLWHHHRRHHNRMADLAANTAMNLHASVQPTHPSGWPRTASIDALLADDFEEWRARRLLLHMQT
jgi:ribonuclease HI